jgi:uncharacterized protein (UPF0276 family)
MVKACILEKSGVGLRLPHLAEIASTSPPAAWLEIHAENFLANPHASELLAKIAERYPISVHTVGVSVGSAQGVDREHLARVRALINWLGPVLVSGHLAWSTHQGQYLNDLLPLPYDEATLGILARHIDEVQEGLGQRYLIENPASYIGFGHSTMTEVEFLTQLARRTGCRLLCDVSNVYLSAHNLGFDARAYIDALRAETVGELHLGGFTADPDDGDPSRQIIIDTHATRIAQPVWELYAYAIARLGLKPTLIEWDNALPPFATLLAEGRHADRVVTQGSCEISRVIAC